MNRSQESHALTIGGQQGVVPITLLGQAEQQIRVRLSRSAGKPLAVRISPAGSADVEGHALDSASVLLNLQLEGDDTAGHAVSVRFPTAEDADKFRRNLLVAGILAGSIVIGSAGAIAITSNLPGSGDGSNEGSQVVQQQVQGFTIPTGINPDTGKPWRSGFQERSDGELTGPADEAPVLQRPEGRGPLETVE